MKILFLYFIELGPIFYLLERLYTAPSGIGTKWPSRRWAPLSAIIWDLNNQIAEVFGISNLANALEREEYLNAILPMEEFEMIDFEEGEKTFNPS